MSLFQCHFFSHSLAQQVEVNVILPQPSPEVLALGGDLIPPTRVLYLLHGLSDDHTTWIRRTSIERYVEGMNLAVVMPAVHRSFYQDMRLGARYWRWVSRELPQLVAATFPISTERRDTFAAGLSMGGYGAMRLGLVQPERFAAVASLSGALDLDRVMRACLEGKGYMSAGEGQAIFASDDPDQAMPPDADLLELLTRSQSSGTARDLPRLYAACGTEDFLWEDNLRFREHAAQLGVELAWRQGPGAHNWAYWDEMIQDVLAWLNASAVP